MSYVKPLLVALTLALLFRSLLFEPFHIPSASMRGTLIEGDYIFVSKYSYGYSKYSFPFGLPIFSGRIMYSAPKRGDVVVFRPKKDDKVSYIKRLIGLPGDKIYFKNGSLYINGVSVNKKQVEDYEEVDVQNNRHLTRQYQEILDNSKSYNVLDHIANSITDNTPVYEVPKGHFFMVGDNRDNSRDSRFINDIGYVPAENLIGRAELVVLSFSNKKYHFPFSLNMNRFFVKL